MTVYFSTRSEMSRTRYNNILEESSDYEQLEISKRMIQKVSLSEVVDKDGQRLRSPNTRMQCSELREMYSEKEDEFQSIVLV